MISEVCVYFVQIFEDCDYNYTRFSLVVPVSSCSNTGSIRDDLYWTSRKDSLELIELSSINKVSLV